MRFDFTVIEDGKLQAPVSVESETIADVQKTATQFAGELLKSGVPEIFETDICVRVSDEHGLILFEIAMHAVEAPAIARPSTYG